MKTTALLCALVAGLYVLAALPAVAQPASIPLWPNGAPGPVVAAQPEVVRLSPLEGERIITNVSQPSITPYLPDPAKATGTAVIVIPGGGHKELWIEHEGYRVGEWLSQHGVAAFVVEYRLSQAPGSPYSLEGDSLGDIQRAIRVVRSRSAQWGVDPARVGVIGFSAGGELAAMAGWDDVAASGHSGDAVDQQSSRPAFEALFYPNIPAHGDFSAATPPTFLLAGDKDRPQVSEGLAELYLQIHRAGGSAEVHILAGAPHGFGLRTTNTPAIQQWPMLFLTWMGAQGLLQPAHAAP